MKLPRALVAGVAGALLVAAPVAIADAEVDSGTYVGKVKRGGTVRFKVTSDKRLARFGFSSFRLKCSDGDTIKLPKLRTGPADRMTISDAGHFAFTAEYGRGAKWIASGNIGAGRAKGRIRAVIRFNRRGQVARHGKIVCDTSRRFSARHG